MIEPKYCNDNPADSQPLRDLRTVCKPEDYHKFKPILYRLKIQWLECVLIMVCAGIDLEKAIKLIPKIDALVMCYGFDHKFVTQETVKVLKHKTIISNEKEKKRPTMPDN